MRWFGVFVTSVTADLVDFGFSGWFGIVYFGNFLVLPALDVWFLFAFVYFALGLVFGLVWFGLYFGRCCFDLLVADCFGFPFRVFEFWVTCVVC